MNYEARQAAMDAVNYHNDARVIAGECAPWYISVSPSETGFSHVAVRVPTADHGWLADRAYDPDEFDGVDMRPMVYGEYVFTDVNCWRCKGDGSLMRHTKYKGMTVRLNGASYDEHYKAMFADNPGEWQREDCPDCGGNGKNRVWSELEEPRLHRDAEDRPYVPFRVVAFPCALEDCVTCRGRGTHVNPSVDAGGLTAEDFRDRDFEESYIDGAYDVTCYECKGTKKVPVIDTELMCPEDLEVHDQWRGWRNEVEREEAYYRAERAAEMRMGC